MPNLQRFIDLTWIQNLDAIDPSSCNVSLESRPINADGVGAVAISYCFRVSERGKGAVALRRLRTSDVVVDVAGAIDIRRNQVSRVGVYV